MNKLLATVAISLIGADAHRIKDAMHSNDVSFVQSGDWFDTSYEQANIKTQNFNQFDGLWHVGNKEYTSDGHVVGGVN